MFKESNGPTKEGTGYPDRFQSKKSRELAGLTQEKLAETIDVSVQYVSDLERGKVGASTATLIRISQALHVSCDYLLLGRGDRADVASILAMLDMLDSDQILLVYDFLRLLLRSNKSHFSSPEPKE